MSSRRKHRGNDEDAHTAVSDVLWYPVGQTVINFLCISPNSGCHVNAKDEDKNTPLHYAAENGHLISVQILLDAGAKLSAKNDEEDTPVHTAAENGRLE